jgi:hypothetical protein
MGNAQLRTDLDEGMARLGQGEEEQMELDGRLNGSACEGFCEFCESSFTLLDGRHRAPDSPGWSQKEQIEVEGQLTWCWMCLRGALCVL